MSSPNPIRRRKPSEEGYILLVVIFMLAILVIALTVAAPAIKKDIQRDRDLETMHRGKQYVRAVKLYYKKFGAYPPTIDALVNTNEIRFLRKKYIDPTTGKEEWKIIRFGQNKTQTMGFFGQAIGGTGVAAAGIGPGGMGSSTSTGIGSPIGGGSASGSADSGTGATTPSGPTPAGTTGSSTDATNGAGGGAAGTDASAAGGSSASASGTGLTGQTFGGGGIIGVSPNSSKESILVYKKKNHYNEWEFFYDPLADQMMQGGNTGMIGQPAGATTTPVGPNSGLNGAPTIPPQPPAPPQQQ
jgi:type II secretory pathway pseudopilin PulG